MKSIYSVEIVQRILDHYGIGTLTYVTYFEYVGCQVWRHYIETTQGEYELYSFPTELYSYAVKRIELSPAGNRGIIFPLLVHSFDRYHILKQLAKKIPISKAQVLIHAQSIQNLQLSKIFRVYGSILQGRFSDGSVWNSYANWNLISPSNSSDLDSQISSKQEIDAVIDSLTEKQLVLKSVDIQGFNIYLRLSNNYTFCFQSLQHHAALELHLANTARDILLYSENQLYYLKEF